MPMYRPSTTLVLCSALLFVGLTGPLAGQDKPPTALAKFRAVEHHRYLLRATNSGVSAIIDPVGTTVVTAKLFQRARIHASIALLDEETPYGRFGDIAGPLSLLAVLAMLIRRRRPNTERSSV